MNPSRSEKYNILFLGFTVPQNVIERLGMAMQTHKLAWGITRGLEVNGAYVDLLSAEPVLLYPSFSQIFFRFKKWDRGNGSWNVLMPFINIIGLRHITRFFACLLLISYWLIHKTNRKQNRIILLHGVQSAHLYASLLLSKFFRVKLVTIMSDPPGVHLPGEGRFVHLLRNIDVYIITKAIQQMDGLIPLTKQISQHYAPSVPYKVIEGILYEEDCVPYEKSITDNDTKGDEKFIILYAGMLKAEYGLDLLLKAFLKTDEPSLQLWVLGSGEFQDQIKAASQEDKRICYMGFKRQNEVKQMMADASVLINPRPSKQYFTQYSFPSKLIEYMASGRPVISTCLPGIPEEYFPHFIQIKDENPESLSSLLVSVSKMNKLELDDFGKAAREFVILNKNANAQGQRILSLVEEIINREH